MTLYMPKHLVNDSQTHELDDSLKTVRFALTWNCICKVGRSGIHIALLAEKRLLYIGVHLQKMVAPARNTNIDSTHGQNALSTVLPAV